MIVEIWPTRIGSSIAMNYWTVLKGLARKNTLAYLFVASVIKRLLWKYGPQ
jgi:hypothetical protein